MIQDKIKTCLCVLIASRGAITMESMCIRWQTLQYGAHKDLMATGQRWVELGTRMGKV